MRKKIIHIKEADIIAGYSSLRDAIIIQALKDYIVSIEENDRAGMYSIEHFFNSQYCELLLMGMDGDYLIEEVKRVYGKK